MQHWWKKGWIQEAVKIGVTNSMQTEPKRRWDMFLPHWVRNRVGQTHLWLHSFSLCDALKPPHWHDEAIRTLRRVCRLLLSATILTCCEFGGSQFPPCWVFCIVCSYIMKKIRGLFLNKSRLYQFTFTPNRYPQFTGWCSHQGGTHDGWTHGHPHWLWSCYRHQHGKRILK